MKCLFSMNVNEVDYSFFTKKTDPGDWSVGCLLMVLMIDIISKHIHKPDVGIIMMMRKLEDIDNHHFETIYDNA